MLFDGGRLPVPFVSERWMRKTASPIMYLLSASAAICMAESLLLVLAEVRVPEQQHKVMIEAVENHMPEVIVIDEIGSEAEASAAATIAQRGVQLVATAHGERLDNILNNPSLQSLLGGVEM